ncbi:P-loop NTPase fold protein [Ectopseudomonas toyotomiensis]|uniref:P-loop NTPase fold protein n=1 Tax=Ectopseudomonas toyotomiensis TaxID=554344 RepID=UPI003D0E8E44
MNHLEKSLQAFFESEAKVAVIKGDWGVGKTYFWDNYISKRIKSRDLCQIAYSYISLFGSSSLDDVRKRVFHNAKAIGSDEKVGETFEDEFNKSSSLFNKIPWVKEGMSKAQSKAPLINWLSKNSQSLPVVSKFSGMISSLEYSLVKNYIVCIDDLERKGKGLAVKEVMGLVDELAQRKDCKVVLIFNESSFDSEEDRKQFESYREKVVDVEVNHNPTSKENLACIFSNEYIRYSTLETVVNNLNIRNIRVIKKIKWALEYLNEFVNGRDDRIIDELIIHTTLLCCFYYIRDNDLTYGMLKDQLSSNSWLSYLVDKEKEVSIGEKKYRTLVSSMNLSSSVFDEHIAFFLENGYVDDEALKATVAELEEKVRVDSVSSRIRRAWDIYSESFSDNLNDFKNALTEIINEDMSRLSLSDFSSAVDILEEFGEDITDFVSSYVQCHADSLSNIDPRHSWDLGRFKCQLLKDKIEYLHNNSKSHNLDDVSLKIAVNRGWNPEDIEFLNSLTKDDYVKWMKENPENLVTKVRGGLLTFRDLQSSGSDQDKYTNISHNVISALKEIASENELNKYRVRAIYGVE